MTIKKYINKYLKDISNKKVIITGANSGIGFECAKLCASLGATVVLACRNKERATKAMDLIIKQYENAKLEYLYFDQSTYKTCKQFIDSLTAEHLDFDVLFFNAGIFHPNNNELNEDGYPQTISTNAINIDYIVKSLYPYLENIDKEKRIIFQGSLASRLSKGKYEICNNKISYFKQYCFSKFALASLFNDYVKYNTNNNIKFMMCEPGITNSNIIRNFPKFIRVLGNGFLKIFMMKTTKAALTGMRCIASDSVKNGDVYAPRGLFRIWGYPKLFKLKRKQTSEEVVKEIRKLNYER